VDVGLGDEMAELGDEDVVFFIVVALDIWVGVEHIRVSVVVVVGIGLLGFPFFENVTQRLFAAEEPYPLSSIAHAWLQDPPFPVTLLLAPIPCP